MRTNSLLPALMIPGFLLAQAGTLDITFDGDGIVLTDLEGPGDIGLEVAVQADGKILTTGLGGGGRIHIARFLPDGTPDVSFHGDGLMEALCLTNYDLDHGLHEAPLAIQDDGKILTTGRWVDNDDEEFKVVRYNSDGTPDDSFGGDGWVMTDVGPSNDRSMALLLQEDGKIVVAGSVTGNPTQDVGVVRYLSDGSLDESFGDEGMVTTAVDIQNDRVFAAALDPDGRIFVAGTAYSNQFSSRAFVLCYLPDGTLDTDFDGDGKVIFQMGSSASDQITDMLLQPDGKILLSGSTYAPSSRRFAVARLNTDGTLDDTFGVDGVVLTPTSFLEQKRSFAMVLQPDGMIVLGGQRMNGDGTVIDLALARYLPNGALDASFGTEGQVVIPINTGDDQAFGMALRPDGELLVVAESHNGTSGDQALLLVLTGLNLGLVEFSGPNTIPLVYPSPLAGEATLEYELLEAEELTCRILDEQGKIVRVLFSGAHRAPGQHRETLDLSALATGQYTLELNGGQGSTRVRILKL